MPSLVRHLTQDSQGRRVLSRTVTLLVLEFLLIGIRVPIAQQAMEASILSEQLSELTMAETINSFEFFNRLKPTPTREELTAIEDTDKETAEKLIQFNRLESSSVALAMVQNLLHGAWWLIFGALVLDRSSWRVMKAMLLTRTSGSASARNTLERETLIDRLHTIYREL